MIYDSVFFALYYAKNVEARDSAFEKEQCTEYSVGCIYRIDKKIYTYQRQISTESKHKEIT